MTRRDNIIATTWQSLPEWSRGVILIGGGLLAWRGGKKWWDRQQEKKRLEKVNKVFQQSIVPIKITDQQGNEVTISVNTATAAVTIHDAIYNNDWFGWTEDETTIVNTLKSIPKQYIPQLKKNYQDLYTKNLVEDVKKALNAEQWKQVDYLF